MSGGDSLVKTGRGCRERNTESNRSVCVCVRVTERRGREKRQNKRRERKTSDYERRNGERNSKLKGGRWRETDGRTYP